MRRSRPLPDTEGYFGQYGGRFVPETLMAPLAELTRAYDGRISLADSDLGGLKAMLELPAAEA